MNYEQLAREMEMQQAWMDELACYQSRNDHEPSDSQRQLNLKDNLDWPQD